MARLIALFLLIVYSFAAKAAEPLPAQLPPDQEDAALRLAEATGSDIYRHDRAASVATDELAKMRAFKKDRRVSGWITEEREGQIFVTIIGSPDAGVPQALYRATVSSAGKVVGGAVVLDAPSPLTEFEAGAAAARTAAMSSSFAPCAKTYNSVALPTGDGPQRKWTVYLLPATTDANLVPIGGTYRVEVDGSGHKVLTIRGFTRSCIQLQNDPRAVGLMITHLLDPTPTEAHVFWSLWAGKPLYVSTPPNGTLWNVEDSKIALVERGEPKTP